MQKEQKHVISILIIFLLIIFNCNSQDVNDDYVILNKIIELTSVSKGDSYNLRKRINADQSDLLKYYDYRFLNKPFYTILKDYNEEKDSIIYDSEKIQEKRKNRWDLKCKLVDSLFTKYDIENFIKPHEMLSFWEKDRVNNASLVKNTGNYISRPYYREDYKYAIVLHYYNGKKTLYILKNNEKLGWHYFSKIDNLWF
ncbi:hypothetical protein [Psychroserpens sp. SPM9]|uniref:hypothetical protein n=1 Tax=Psychroserpens sp. SPM9 TaxID=2975598 RepID=UPI0021A88DBA|nr:hypothetical protein [Psychroserpens sp. SPM9]MDG5492862.1 hypothetical protein [Psychroserpens sp. SPM9]